MYSDKLCIIDIIESVEKIQYYLKDCTLEQLNQDEMRQDAVIRRFEILGEATAKISKSTRDKLSEIAWREMKRTRNYLIHNYKGISI
ncbi:MAG: DUF86 domain-containing protein [Cytophagales bacterium]